MFSACLNYFYFGYSPLFTCNTSPDIFSSFAAHYHPDSKNILTLKSAVIEQTDLEGLRPITGGGKFSGHILYAVGHSSQFIVLVQYLSDTCARTFTLGLLGEYESLYQRLEGSPRLCRRACGN
jgi:hypothetical protein